MIRPKPVVLVTLSGVGVSPMMEGNALKQASMPAWKHLIETYPALLLEASGTSVGLTVKSVGNPEAGHRTMGLGKPWKTSAARAEAGTEEHTLPVNAVLRKHLRALVKRRGTLHLAGLLSTDETYANRRYVEAIAAYAHHMGVQSIAFHVITDGVNAPPNGAQDLVQHFDMHVRECGYGAVRTICGRNWGMDHDGFWNRTSRAFHAMVYGVSDRIALSVEEAIQSSYAHEVWDDALEPVVLSAEGVPYAGMRDGDLVVFWNIRPYGMRQLVKAFALPTMQSFDRPELPDLICLSLVEYDYDLPIEVIFPSERPRVCMGSVLSQFGLKQLRIAEAERFAHVTVFLNGMTEESFAGEERVIIQSPAISSYEHVPGMAMSEVSSHVVKAIASGSYDCIVCNLCGPDIAAGTGDEALTVKACELMDRALHRMIEATLAVGGVLIAVGDSGHAEALRDQMTNEIQKTSSSNPVPCVIVGSSYEGLKAAVGDVVGGDLALSKPSGSLADIAPTILHILSVPIPKEMTGKTLI